MRWNPYVKVVSIHWLYCIQLENLIYFEYFGITEGEKCGFPVIKQCAPQTQDFFGPNRDSTKQCKTKVVFGLQALKCHNFIYEHYSNILRHYQKICMQEKLIHFLNTKMFSGFQMNLSNASHVAAKTTDAHDISA